MGTPGLGISRRAPRLECPDCANLAPDGLTTAGFLLRCHAMFTQCSCNTVPAPAEVPLRPLPARFPPMHILLIEDEADLAATLKSALQRERYVVDLANTLALAREAALSGSHDLVLLDRTLPDVRWDSCRTASPAWMKGPTTTWPSPSTSANWKPAAAPCCAGPSPRPRACSASAP
ncbi:hypothetical protein G6F63_014550 [Rhizopus arrhizus]|nr:hypothetical protein G6F63_014550 [Rhizopus arrhizus]